MANTTIYVLLPAPLQAIQSTAPASVWQVPASFAQDVDPALAGAYAAAGVVSAFLSGPDILVRSRRLHDFLTLARFDIDYVQPSGYHVKFVRMGFGATGVQFTFKLGGSQSWMIATAHGASLLLMMPDELTDLPPSSFTLAGTLDVTLIGL